MDDLPPLPAHIYSAIRDAALLGPKGLVRKRDSAVKRYEDLAETLAPRERDLHRTLNPEVEAVVADKRILLFKRMLADISYDDMGVADLLVTGVRITGEAERSGVWRHHLKGGQVTRHQLWETARGCQEKVLKSASNDWPQLAQKLWAATLEEVGSTLVGPLEVDRIEREVGPLWIAARRFAVEQGPKLRPIDDYSEFNVNAAFTSTEKLTLVSVDSIVSWTRALLNVGDDRTLRLSQTPWTRSA